MAITSRMATTRQPVKVSVPPQQEAPKITLKTKVEGGVRDEDIVSHVGTDVKPVRCAFCQRSDGDIVALSTGTPAHVQCLRNAALSSGLIDSLVNDAVAVRMDAERTAAAVAAKVEEAKAEVAKSRPARYSVSSPESCEGIVIHGSDPSMQSAYRRFAKDSLGMGDYVPISIPQGLGKLVSPLSMKFASELLGCVSEVIKANGSRRVVCIVRREEVESTPLRHLVHVPSGSDLATHLMEMGRKAIKAKLGIDVEMYLAEVQADGEVKFFRLDG